MKKWAYYDELKHCLNICPMSETTAAWLVVTVSPFAVKKRPFNEWRAIVIILDRRVFNGLLGRNYHWAW